MELCVLVVSFSLGRLLVVILIWVWVLVVLCIVVLCVLLDIMVFLM